MYRKIMFIFFTILPSLSNETKTVILLFISAISFFQTLKCRPFFLRELNILDLSSNLTALITIFAGAIYILDVSEAFKALIFIIIVLINAKFAIKWFGSILDIFVYSYESKIYQLCPWFLNLYLILKQANEKTKPSFFLPKYIYDFMKNIKNFKMHKL